MRIVVASQSPLKLQACRESFQRSDVEFITIGAESNVPMQPFEDETITGAFNRFSHARRLYPGADLYIAIENGIYREGPGYSDYAVVYVGDANQDPVMGHSEGVDFPALAVETAQARGFDNCTVGQILKEMGYVEDANDPHQDLSCANRVHYMKQAIEKALKKFPAMA